MQNRPREQSVSLVFLLSEKLSVISELFKLRLNIMVLFSSVFGYIIGMSAFDIWLLAALVTGGFLVTGASNTLNQIIERETDAIMSRTAMRPLPTGRIGLVEAWTVAALSGTAGICILYFLVNPLAGILAALSLFIYVVLYTPLKKITGFSVFVGAFPGAIPPMLGWVGATGYFGLEAGLLFAIQFMWQFPHFWAIAWLSDEDYRRAGFRLLPSPHGKNNFSSFNIFLYSLMLIPVSVSPYVYNMTGGVAGTAVFVFGLLFAYPALRLYLTLEDKYARQLMFASFIYLPAVLLIIFIDKFI